MVSSIQHITPIVVRTIESTNSAVSQETKLSQDAKLPKENESLAKEPVNAENSKTKQKEDSNPQVSDFSELAEKLQRNFGDENVAFEITIDKETSKMILKLVDTKTDEVIRQFPPEITLKIARMIAAYENSNGQLANAKV